MYLLQNIFHLDTFIRKMKKTSLYLSALLMAVALLYSCKPDESDIGAGLIPGQDQLNTLVYEVPLQSKTVLDDSALVYSGGIGVGTLLLGSYVDPVFGKTSTGFAAEFAPLVASATFGKPDSFQIDSVVLSLEYASGTGVKPYYGDVSKLRGAQKVKVYRWNEEISDTTKYYSNYQVQYSTLLGEKSFVPNFSTVTFSDTFSVTEPAQLRIKLNADAVNLFKNANDSMVDRTTFYKYLQGLYVVADNGFQQPGDGAILRFNAAACRIRVYYKNNTNNSSNPFDFLDFVSTTTTRKIALFQHNYANTQVQQAIQSGFAADKLYIQPLAGVKTKVILPDFDTIPEFADTNAKYVVNRAELVIPADVMGYSFYYPVPNSLVAYAVNPDALYDNVANPPGILVRDYTDVSQFYYGGKYDTETSEFVLRISLHLSDILNRKVKDKGLYLATDFPNTEAKRLIISNETGRKIRLRLIYTKI
jgi:Domain of unknown function (DUF4270)